MKVVIRREAPESVAADALVVGLHAEDKRWPPSLAALDQRASGQVKAVLEAEKFSAKAGQVTHIHTPALDRKSTRLNSSHSRASRMPSSA